jgi:multidrug efflux pump subunit AcrB
MLLIQGSTGDYAYSLPMVIIILLLSSWFLSMYQTPALSYWFMKVKEKPEGSDQEDIYSGAVYQRYRAIIGFLLAHKPLVLIAAGGTLIFGFFIATQLVQEFFGPSGRNQLLVYYDLPAGSSITKSEEITKQLANWLEDDAENPEITRNIGYIGTGGPRFFLSLSPVDPDPHRGFMIVDTESGDQVFDVADRMREYFAMQLPEVNARVKPMWLGANEPGYVEIRFYGRDRELLYAKAEEFLNRLRATPGMMNLRNNWENKVLKINVEVDQARARRNSVTSQDVARSLEAHIDGVTITEYREKDLAIPVVLRSLDEQRRYLGDLWNINVFSRDQNQYVPLIQVADLSHKWEFSRIARRNLERCVTIEMKHDYLKAPELLAMVTPVIDELDLGPGFHWDVGGEPESSGETMGYLFENMPLCLFVILMLIIWQFNSFRRAFIILFTIPLAYCGSFLALFRIGAPFDFFAILGLFSLAGVIINNGIVLIDRIESLRAEGMDPHQAVIQSAVSRLRPIVMTTVTTFLGVLPLIISHDPLFYSLSIVLGFGLVFGTVLTLGVVPAIYELLMRVKTTPTAPTAAQGEA